MNALSIRDRIKVIQGQLVAGNFSPQLVREHLLTLTGLFGLVLIEHREADHEHNLILNAYMECGDSSVRARVRASISPQYLRSREARDTEKLVITMIQASKKYLESLDTEMRLAG